jgi:hypothetical protein
MADQQPTDSTIREFCRRRRISVSSFYENRPMMPRTIKVGPKRVIITAEDEAAWLERQRAAADAESGRWPAAAPRDRTAPFLPSPP